MSNFYSIESMDKYLQNRTSEFIEKSIMVHGERYDYSKVKYISTHKKVCIICRKHGEFYQAPSNHLSGKECLKCSYEKRIQKITLGKEKFIEKSIEEHGDKFDYSKVEYINSKTKVCIICKN